MTNSTIVSAKVLDILTNSTTSYNDLEVLGFEQDILMEIQDWKEEGFSNIEISEKIILYVNVMELNTIARKIN